MFYYFYRETKINQKYEKNYVSKGIFDYYFLNRRNIKDDPLLVRFV